jgi:hypothetical protein
MGFGDAFICYSLFRLLSSRFHLSPVASAMGIEHGRKGASISVSLSMLERKSSPCFYLIDFHPEEINIWRQISPSLFFLPWIF